MPRLKHWISHAHVKVGQITADDVIYTHAVDLPTHFTRSCNLLLLQLHANSSNILHQLWLELNNLSIRYEAVGLIIVNRFVVLLMHVQCTSPSTFCARISAGA
jgi:hypothetical protein